MDIPEINELIKTQESYYNEIQRIWDNIKKDSSTRKTKTYIDERKALLERLYRKALENHNQLQDQEVLSTHKYITQNYFNINIENTYEAAIDHLNKCKEKLEKLRDIADIKDKGNKDNKSPQLFIQKYRLKQFEKKTSTALVAIAENKSVGHLQALIRHIEKQFQDIENNHIQLLVEQSTFDDEYFINDYFQDAQEQYDSILEKLQESISGKDGQNRNHSTNLPRISMPIFTGGYESWNSFYDLFKRIIDDDCTISPTEKMQYLKTHVRGDAEKLIKHLNVNEVNYEAALKLLENRYKDERLIAQTFIDKLLDLPKIHYPNAKMLRDMHDCINESLEALKSQNIEVSTWGPILSRIVSRKWDQDTNMKYEDQLEEPNKLQEFGKMMKFLEKRFKSLESNHAKSTSSTDNQTSTSIIITSRQLNNRRTLGWHQTTSTGSTDIRTASASQATPGPLACVTTLRDEDLHA
ncbi:hypothetical protein NE865_05833 [Phthorimaea operculella]|nr:hypothetical protein NE865_05833 [Phthorimaea operculella]